MKQFLFFLLLGVLAILNSALAQPRVALVIGNNAYTKIEPLGNAVNDAAAVALQFRQLGFQVTHLIDANAKEIESAKQTFLKTIANGAVAVFYFAGHGVQLEGRNYLLPTDLGAVTEDAVAKQAFSVPRFLDELDASRPRLSLLILDACRDNPFREMQQRTVQTRGLGEVAKPIPSGTVIIYAASSNQTALDALGGNDRSPNGLFTRELLVQLKEPGVEIRDMARRVRYSVMEKAQTVGHMQIPALYDNLSVGEFYFSGAPRQPAPGPVSVAAPSSIRLILPAAASGPMDRLVRAALPYLSKELGVEVTAENQVDIAGDRVAAMLVEAPKNGSVMLVSPFVASARRARGKQFELEPVAMLADTPVTVAVSSRVSASSLADLVAQAKNRRTPFTMTVATTGSVSEMCGQQLQKKLGADVITLQQVNGEALAFMAALQGQTDLICSPRGPLDPHLAGGKLKAVAEIASSASAVAAGGMQVARAASQGYDVVVPNWLGLFAPPGTPADVVNRISAAMTRVQANRNFAEDLKRLSALTVSTDQSSPQGLAKELALGMARQQ